jgi:hypothetical protein
MMESLRFRRMKTKITILLLYIAWLIAAVMLVFAAAQKQSDSFYTLLRWICCAVFAYSAVTSFRMKRVLWLWIFAVLAVLFNPIFLSLRDRSLWIAADWFSIVAMVIAAFVFWKASKTLRGSAHN